MSPCRSSAASRPFAMHEAMDSAPNDSRNSRRSRGFRMLKILLFPSVQLFDMLPEIFERPRAPHFHCGGELAVLDAQFAIQDAVLPDLLERGELFVDALDRFPKLLRHRTGRNHFRRGLALEGLHSFERLRHLGVD